MRKLVLILIALIAIANVRADPAQELIEAAKATSWVFTHIKYVRDKNPIKVRTPLETIYEGKGDCQDQALLVAAFLDEIDVQVDLHYFTYTTPEGIAETHVIVELYNFWFDPTLNARFHDGMPFRTRTTYLVSYSKVLYQWAVKYHSKAAARMEIE